MQRKIFDLYNILFRKETTIVCEKLLYLEMYLEILLIFLKSKAASISSIKYQDEGLVNRIQNNKDKEDIDFSPPDKDPMFLHILSGGLIDKSIPS